MVLLTGTKWSFMGYFKRQASPTKSQVMCRWDGKEVSCVAGGYGFEPHAPRIYE